MYRYCWTDSVAWYGPVLSLNHSRAGGNAGRTACLPPSPNLMSKCFGPCSRTHHGACLSVHLRRRALSRANSDDRGVTGSRFKLILDHFRIVMGATVLVIPSQVRTPTAAYREPCRYTFESKQEKANVSPLSLDSAPLSSVARWARAATTERPPRFSLPPLSSATGSGPSCSAAVRGRW